MTAQSGDRAGGNVEVRAVCPECGSVNVPMVGKGEGGVVYRRCSNPECGRRFKTVGYRSDEVDVRRLQ